MTFNRSLARLVIFIALWSTFYAGVKYFFWGIHDDTFTPSLEQISGYILIGSMVAYVIGGFLYRRFGDKMMLIFATLGGFISLIGGVLTPSSLPSVFFLSCIGAGFSYSTYVIGKNMLIGAEMTRKGVNISFVGALTTIAFIVFMIAGTIAGAKVGETTGGPFMGTILFGGILLGLFLMSIAMKNVSKEEKVSQKIFYKEIFVKYGLFIIGLSCFWEISVEVSQMAIRFSKEAFGHSNTEASLLLIFSSIGAIIGNTFSVRFSHKKVLVFTLMSSCLLFIIGSFGGLLEYAYKENMYFIVEILAGMIGFLFGGAVNLAESHFLSKLGNDPGKDYISSLYGFAIASIGTIIMFSSEKILSTGSFMGTSFFLGIVLLFSIYICRKNLIK